MKYLIPLAAIASITILACVAMLCGINHIVLSLAI
ncbi:unnamed protein product, partial [marine sediment metagenome]